MLGSLFLWTFFLISLSTSEPTLPVRGYVKEIGPSEHYGASVANIGDFNGDGFNDIVVGAPGYRNGQGAIYILFLDESYFIIKSTRIASEESGLSTLDPLAMFGSSVTYLGDMDGGGDPYVAVGAPGAFGTGALYILGLGTKTEVITEIIYNGTDTRLKLETGDKFGSSVDKFHLEGKLFLLVGASNRGGAGAIYVINVDATTNLGDIIEVQIISDEIPLESRDFFGASVTYLGDWDENGEFDFFVGAPGDDEIGEDSGAIYLISWIPWTTPPHFKKITPEHFPAGFARESVFFGRSLSLSYESDAKKYPHIMVGSLGDNTTGALHVGFLSREMEFIAGYDILNGVNGMPPEIRDGSNFGISSAYLREGVILVGSDQDSEGGPSYGALFFILINPLYNCFGRFSFEDTVCNAEGICLAGDNCDCKGNWDSVAGCTTCLENYFGDSCTVCPDCVNGTCNEGVQGNGTCACYDHWALPLCDDCVQGYFGYQCDPCLPCVNGICDDGISGNGTCSCFSGSNGYACSICLSGYYSDSCLPCPICDHGECDDGNAGDGTCECISGWDGELCDTCAVGFSGQGCQNCNTNYFGPLCSLCPSCVHGDCIDGKQGSGLCNCTGGYKGPLCTIVDLCYSGCQNGTLLIDDDLELTDNSTSSVNNLTVSGTLTVSGNSLLIIDQDLTVESTINVQLGTISVTGGAFFSQQSTTVILPGSSLQIGGCASFDGKLDLGTVEESTVIPITYSCHTGEFDSITANNCRSEAISTDYTSNGLSVIMSLESCQTFVESSGGLIPAISILLLIILN